MSVINTVTGKKYRILKDAANKIWDQISFWTSSDDVEFADGMTAEQKVGAMKGIVTTEQMITGYVMDASVTALAPKVFNGVVRPTGPFTMSFTDPVITSTSRVQIYTDQWAFIPSSVTTSGNTLTVTFPTPSALVNVKIEVGEFHT